MKWVLPFIYFIFSVLVSFGQQQGKTFRIYFTNKKYSPYTLSHPLDYISQRSIDRRIRQHVNIDSTDLPVSPAYLDSLEMIGGKMIYTSKWLNAATFVSDDSLFAEKALLFDFVKGGRKVFKRSGQVHTIPYDNLPFPAGDYGRSFRQLDINKGQYLHYAGYTGKGIQIAVLDAGFYGVDSLQAFARLRSHDGILAYKDFINNENMLRGAKHGMWVLSTMAGYIPGKIIGAAPDAGYYLIHTENNFAEVLAEEDAWVAGLEWADSAGADIISSSLGYTQFNDSTMDHTYADLDGKTAFASRAASMAASKGIIVVNSAGNSGANSWHFISVPADASDILTVGAVDSFGHIANFSSRGYTADRRIKPDVDAMGVQTLVASADVDGDTARVNGTSLSCPIIAGLTACLWQEFPDKNAYEIMNAIRLSSDHYYDPDDSFGYGIADFKLASLILAGKNKLEDASFYPNPFSSLINIEFFTSETGDADLILLDIYGRILGDTTVNAVRGRLNRAQLEIDPKLPQGIYFIMISTSKGRTIKKLIKR
jgi:subtilisin family serine protease